MRKNKDVLFSNVPQMNIQRSIFHMPQNIRTTFNAGELVPFFVMECLPSDSIRLNTSKVVRLQTLLTPIYDNLFLDTMYFFVPNRLVWTHWKEFMGENTSSAYLPEVTYTPPLIKFNNSTYGNIGVCDVLDYMGLPVLPTGVSNTDYCQAVAFPYRGYQLLWNEFFRDQNLQDPVNINTGDSDTNWKDVSSDDKKCLPVNKLHDYFTSALRSPAKSAAGYVTAWASVSNSGYANSGLVPVVTGTDREEDGIPMRGNLLLNGDSQAGLKLYGATLPGSGTSDAVFSGSVSNVVGYYPTNLWADLTPDDHAAIGISIPNLRTAYQMQKFLERDARSGTRYQEIILSHFNCRAEDARMQRPEYLGGNRIPLNIQQITNQAQSSGQYLGDVGAMSLTTDNHSDVEFSCSEHGFIIGVMCVRYKHSYQDGIERYWYRSSRTSYAWPEFSQLTDQPIYNWELFSRSSEDYDLNDIFGYAERYAEYKMRLDKNTGEMRAGISNSLSSWHLGDYYTDPVYLSDSWIREDKTNVDRTLAVTSSVSNQIMADINVDCFATRALPVHTLPGLSDHF